MTTRPMMRRAVYAPLQGSYGFMPTSKWPVFRYCDHPFGDDLDDPQIFLEVEVGRDTATGWQHLAWVDTDPDTPGVQQRTAISRDNPPTVNWNAKAASSAPLADGTDSLVYDSLTTFARALPAVTAGQYVPPPFATIVSRTYDDHDNRCTCGGHFMDDGKKRWPPMYLGFIISGILHWRIVNELYLEFVFPLTPSGGNP